jgi:hypothetical protein
MFACGRAFCNGSFNAVLNLGFSVLAHNSPDNLAGTYNDLGGNTFI